MSMYRSYGGLGNSNTPPQNAQRGASTSAYGYTASPQSGSQFGGYNSYGQQQSGFQGSSSMQQSTMGSTSSWNAPNTYGQGQTGQAPVSGTPQGPKQFSWGLPIANYTPKSAGEDLSHGSPESPRAMHGTPSGTPNRPQNPLYPTFDADDEAPPRESTLGLDDDDMVSSPPPPVASTSAPPRQEQQPSQPAQQTTHKVVVFGFSPASQQAVLQAFKALGEVVDVQQGPHTGANWFTLAYSKQWDASLALRKSGEVISGTMIGVKWADGSPSDSYVPPPSSSAGATQSLVAATPNRPPPPLGERVNVLSANEALKRPSTAGSPAPGVLARLTGSAHAAAPAAGAPPTSPHANLFKQQGTPSRGWSQAISSLVFGE